MTDRIVVTGIGGLCSLGTNAPAIWSAMKAGTCGIGELEIPEKAELKTTIAGQIGALPPHAIEPRLMATMSRFTLLAVLAAAEAMQQAGLARGSFDPWRTGAVIGTGVFGVDAVDQAYNAIIREGKKRTEIFAVPKIMPSSPSAHVSMALGLKGPVFGATSACASSNHAIANALDMLRAGRADVIVAGGTDAPVSFGIMKAWEAMRILAKTGCRPFSADREGLVLGDGAGALVLETEAHARARGATILAVLAGAGMTADAGDIVSPDKEGAAMAMRLCLEDAGLSAADIGYLNAHGTGTLGNDRTETAAIRSVFGAHADSMVVSSTKSMHAHCLGASGVLEAIACIMALHDQIVPPTINLTVADPECDLDYVAEGARAVELEAVVSNSFAFGGSNAVLAFTRP